jgi:hypothetical protein
MDVPGRVYPAVIGTARRDGRVAMTPVWFEYADGRIRLTGGPGRAWFKRVERTGKASLLMLDPKNISCHARIDCRLVGSTTEGADEHIDRLAHRYLGGPYRNPKVGRVIVELEPTAARGPVDRAPLRAPLSPPNPSP